MAIFAFNSLESLEQTIQEGIFAFIMWNLIAWRLTTNGRQK